MTRQPVEVRGNAIAPRAPKRDGNGITARQFAERLFESEYCDECHGDIKDHVYVIGAFGLWFACCRGIHVADCKVCEKQRQK
jgi:hypothetical protein